MSSTKRFCVETDICKEKIILKTCALTNYYMSFKFIENKRVNTEEH